GPAVQRPIRRVMLTPAVVTHFDRVTTTPAPPEMAGTPAPPPRRIRRDPWASEGTASIRAAGHRLRPATRRPPARARGCREVLDRGAVRGETRIRSCRASKGPAG